MSTIRARLDHLHLLSPQPARLVDFYQGVMGMPAERVAPDLWVCTAHERAVLIEQRTSPGLRLGAYRFESPGGLASMREHLAPLDLVVPDQLVDRTVARPRTFFDADAGCVVHVSLAEPFCPDLRGALRDAAGETGARVHDGGVYVCIEGPQFSTRGESRLYRSWGVDVIGMTALPEARLAREAELCYATLALVTDYDVWKTDEEPVSVQMVVERLHHNAAVAQAVVRALVPHLAAGRTCTCGAALEHAIITDRALIPPATRERLGLLLGRYLG